MRREDPEKPRRVDRAEQASLEHQRYFGMALAYVRSFKVLYAEVSPLIAAWKQREQRAAKG